jgi:8-oxo-dGTP pyrophosphatase MutT (NUDIX family)
MTERIIKTKRLGLDKTVARCAVVVQEKNPRTQESHVAVGMVNRPYWSKQGANEWSLPGGKVNDDDINHVELQDQDRAVSLGQLEEVTRNTAKREIAEELNIEANLDQLNFVGFFQNGEWVTALFYLLLDQRPSISLGQKEDPMDEIDGFIWLGADRAAVGTAIFADHKVQVDQAVAKAMNSVSAKNAT